MTIKKTLAVLAAILFTVTMASAAVTSKANLGITKHGNIGSTPGACTGCHKPHNGANGQILLWNPVLATGSFATYGGGSLATPTVPWTEAQAKTYSYLCLSCHDSTAAGLNSGIMNSQAPQNMTLGPNVLKDDHPVDMAIPIDPAYNLAADIQTAGKARLFGSTPNEVECASCHDPHDNANTKYLRSTLTELCIACHK